MSFEQLSTKEGLSHSVVTCTLQDREGFMWIGTQDGLNRFDGYSFLLFEHDASDKNSLSNNNITCLYEDREGNIWVGTSDGLNKLDKTTNTFRTYHHDPANAHSLSHNDIRAIYEDRLHTLWVGTYIGLNKLNRTTNIFTLYEHIPGHPNKWAYNQITKMCEDRQGNFWLGTNQGISRFDRKSHQFTRYPLPGIEKNIIDHRFAVRDMLEDRQGNLWVATSGHGLIAFDRKTHQFKVYLPDQKEANSIFSAHLLSVFEDSFGTLWIGTQDKGLYRFDRPTEKFIPLNPDLTQLKTTLPLSIVTIYEDRSKVLWLGTYEGGLFKTDLLSKKFRHVFHKPNDNNSIRTKKLFTLYEDHSGNVWIGNNVGFDKLDKSRGTFTHYTYPPPAPKNPWENNNNCIYEDNKGFLWFGLTGGGLKKFDPRTKLFTSYLHNPTDSNGLPHGIVNIIYQDKKARIWVGTRFGLARLDEDKKKFISYTPSFVTASKCDITSIVEDQDGLLWVAAAQYGLLKFNPEDGIFTPFAYQNSAGTKTKAIHQLYSDGSGLLWVCLLEGGLLSIDLKTARWKTIVSPKALSKMVIMGILEDGKGNLWLSTSKNGLLRFNPSTNALTNYDVTDGLQANEFNMAYCKNDRGEMYFGGGNGFNVFHPDSITSNPYVPPVAISSFKVFDKPRSFTKEITLPYSDNFISFDFVALSYAFSAKNRYAYRLEGFDKTWIQASTRRYASFTNLEPGEYVFRVKAANHDGVWNEQGASVKITITPPLWRTTGAYLLYVVLVIGLSAGIRHNTLKQVRLKNNLILKDLEAQKMMELDQLKSHFFTSISHEFRTPLTLILSPLEQAFASKGILQQPAIRLMRRNTHRLLELINQLLDISKLEAKKMQWEVKPGDLIPLLKATVFSFLSFAESKHIGLSFECALDSLPMLFDQDKLEKVVTNLLANALKFTPAQGEVKVKVSVSTETDKRWIVLEVEDTGIGIPAEQITQIFDRFYQVDSSHTRAFEGTGIGLALTKELVELQQGTIRVRSTPGQGSCFTIQLPILAVKGEYLVSQEELVLSTPKQFDNWSGQEYKLQDTPPSLLDNHLPLLLITEDHAELRSYLCSIFQNDYRILEATNGEQGLQLALEMVPDLVISDWMMPKMDGVQLCHQLKTDERTSHIPIILLTAKAAIQSKMEGLQTGADDYIIKPFHNEELLIRAKNLISQRKSLRERWNKEFTMAPAITGVVDSCSDPIPSLAGNPIDEKFLRRVIQLIDDHLADADFTIDWLGKEAGMSQTLLYRKIKALTNQSPSEFIRNYRLKKAAELLSQRRGNVSEIAYQVGFTHLSYFTKTFRQVYGLTPSEYAATQDLPPG
ncbi:MAG: two-component regulator propeller domain-containing protein [Bacteroidota bacterium]